MSTDHEEHDFRSLTTNKQLQNELDDVQRALHQEIAIFTKRENLLQDFKVRLRLEEFLWLFKYSELPSVMYMYIAVFKIEPNIQMIQCLLNQNFLLDLQQNLTTKKCIAN